MRISIYRRGHFNAAHRLYNPSWDEEQNLATFGKCSSPNFHGHNYEIEVKVTGEINKESGMLIDLKDLKDLIKEQIEDRFDHKNLNLDVEEFDDLIPTAENVCIVSWKILREHLDPEFELKVRLYETPRNYVEYPA